jgi:hypothetical protein
MNYNMGKWNFFVRQDMMEIEDLSNSDKSLSYIGAIWNPVNGLYISPNIIMNDTDDEMRLTFMFKY